MQVKYFDHPGHSLELGYMAGAIIKRLKEGLFYNGQLHEFHHLVARIRLCYIKGFAFQFRALTLV